MQRNTSLYVLVIGLWCGASASATSIHDFARMKLPDQAGYVSTLVEGTAELLKKQGHPDQAQKLIDLFHDADKTGGLAQFVSNLKMMENMNNRSATNPNRRERDLLMEDAMAKTLKDNGMIVSTKELLVIGSQ